MTDATQTDSAKRYFNRNGEELCNVVITKTPSPMETFVANMVEKCGMKHVVHSVFGYRVSRVVGKGNVIGSNGEPLWERSVMGDRHFVKTDKKKKSTSVFMD